MRRRADLARACAGLSLLAAGPAAAQEPELAGVPDLAVQYYVVRGATPTAVLRDIEAKGPMDDGGRRAHGRTDVRFRYGWTTDAFGRCDLKAATASFTITVLLPRLKTPPRGEAMKEWWPLYRSALVRHERGHVDITLTHLSRLQAAIRAATCSTADEAAQRAIAAWRKANDDYDAATDHGRKGQPVIQRQIRDMGKRRGF